MSDDDDLEFYMTRHENLEVPEDAGAGAIARYIATELADAAARPEWRAGFAASMITAAILARTGAGLGSTVLLAVLAGGCTEHAYSMLMDMHAVATDDADVS